MYEFFEVMAECVQNGQQYVPIHGRVGKMNIKMKMMMMMMMMMMMTCVGVGKCERIPNIRVRKPGFRHHSGKNTITRRIPPTNHHLLVTAIALHHSPTGIEMKSHGQSSIVSNCFMVNFQFWMVTLSENKIQAGHELNHHASPC